MSLYTTITILALAMAFSMPCQADTATGMAGYWKFDEGTGTDAADSSGSGNAGTLTLMADPATETSGWNSAGKYSNSLSFDGSNDLVALGNDTFDAYSSGSISVWVNPTDFTAQRTFVGQAATGDDSRLFVTGTDTSGYPFVQSYYSGGVWNNKYRTTNAITAGQWSHIVITGDGSTWKIYINGVQETLVAVAGSNSGQWFAATSTGVTNPYKIGYLNATYPFPMYGKLDDVRIYSRVLVAKDAYALYIVSNKVKNAKIRNARIGH